MRVVLKSSRKYISSKRTPTTAVGWNLASAGRYQRDVVGCLEGVRKLRLVVLEFGGVEGMFLFPPWCFLFL